MSVWQVVTHRRVMGLALIYAGSVATNYGLSFWQPQIIKSFGMDNFRAGLINAIPFFIGSIAMVLWGRRSDRVGERVWHTAIALFVSAAGLAACLGITALIPTVIALSVALVGCYALKGPFWALSTEFLGAGAAAAGIAQINAIGNLAGFVGPFLLGWIKDHTGSYTLGMLPMITLALVGGVVVLVMGKHAPHTAPAPVAALHYRQMGPVALTFRSYLPGQMGPCDPPHSSRCFCCSAWLRAVMAPRLAAPSNSPASRCSAAA